MTVNFRFHDIGYGWLCMKIQIDRHYIIWSFDEALSDPLPDMIRMYNALKQRKDAVWFKERGGTVEFKTTFSDNKYKVKLRIKIEKAMQAMVCDECISEVEYEQMEENVYNSFEACLEGEAEFATDYLLWEFTNFFNLVTSSQYYPKHYPCYSMLNEEEYAANDRKCTKFYEKYKNEYNKNFWDEYDKRELVKNVHLKEEGELYYKKFDEMMNKYVIPDNW